ncbi:MAG: glycogen debranching N-terminal domain-containing protein, partial [Nitrososphaerales archaeon]
MSKLHSKLEGYGHSKEASHMLARIQPKRPAGVVSLFFTQKPTVDILNGNSFMVTSNSGDISEMGHGLFRNDTRFLSRYVAKINGRTLTTLTSSNTTHYSAAFYLTNPDCPIIENNASSRENSNKFIPKEHLAIHRRRFIEEDVREEFFVTNVSEKNITFTLLFEADADFVDLFEVKSAVFTTRPDVLQKKSSIKGGRKESSKGISKRFITHENAFDFKWLDKSTRFKAQTILWFSKRGRVKDSGSISYDVTLKPKKTFHLTIVAILLTDRERKKGKYTDQYFQKQEEKIENALQKWNISVPKLETDWDELKHSYYQSLVDIVSLRMSDPHSQHKWQLPAAGCPWFMTLFGRDTLITAYQTILFGPNLARGGIEALSEYQARRVNDNKDEEPGKIIHELRYGDYAAKSNRFPYYGT